MALLRLVTRQQIHWTAVRRTGREVGENAHWLESKHFYRVSLTSAGNNNRLSEQEVVELDDTPTSSGDGDCLVGIAVSHKLHCSVGSTWTRAATR